MRPFSKAIAWLCLLLTLWLAAAAVAHHHESGTESAKCMVCVAVHSAPPAAQIVLPVATFIAISQVPQAPALIAKQQLAILAFTVRPPPQL